jgi:PXA domain/RUN domain
MMMESSTATELPPSKSSQEDRIDDMINLDVTPAPHPPKGEWWSDGLPRILARWSNEQWDIMTWAAVGGVTILLLPYLWPLLRTLLGTALGMALGLGWATHVCNQLDRWEERQLRRQQEDDASHKPLRNRTLSSVMTISSSNRRASTTLTDHHPSLSNPILQDDQTYESLMASAGYAGLADPLRRGQVLRPDQVPPVRYRFDHRALTALQQLFADHLPAAVQVALAKAMEFILRDFVAVWYALMDTGCVDPAQAMVGTGRDASTTAAPQDHPSHSTDPRSAPPAHHHYPSRVMLYSLAVHRPLPFLDALYHNCALLFGNLATRVEQVNVPQLVLCHFTKILAHSFQVYRHVRKQVRAKQLLAGTGSSTTSSHVRNKSSFRRSVHASHKRSHLHATPTAHQEESSLPAASTEGPPISEMAMTKEFLILGKFHKALTFGLDVPSLLYADALGHDADAEPTHPDDLLAQRLFHTPLLQECELDYHRVLGHKMVKALLPRHEFGSTLLQTLLTEIMAGSVLTPILSLFCPDTISSWIVMGLTPATTTTEATETTSLLDALDAPNHPSLTPLESIAEASEETERPVAVPAPPRTAVVDHESLTRLLALTLMELEPLVDFESVRDGGQDVDWDGDACRTAIVRLVLVLEAALLQGRCTYRRRNDENAATLAVPEEEEEELPLDDDAAAVEEVEVTLPDYESMSWTQVLMEMTGDLEAFEQRVAADNILVSSAVDETPPWVPIVHAPTATEISSLRTLIAAWLERGQIYRTVTLLVQAHATVLTPYYHPAAFLRSTEDAHAFVRQLQLLDQVPILVDTVTVLSSPRLEEGPAATIRPTPITTNTTAPPPASSLRGTILSPSSAATSGTNSLPRHLDFHRNESLAASLRSERERRQQSWDRLLREDVTEAVRSKAPDGALHKELHHIAMLFYYETVLVSIRDAARRAPDGLVALLTVEAAGPKRRLEIPDDDSSFLLRGPPRVLNAVGVHRDPRNHDHSYKSFAGHIEEIAQNELYNGGRYLHRCLLRYYPSDRTASVDRLDDARKLDQRKSVIPDTITLSKSTTLSDEFMNNRYLCQRWVPKGTTRSQSLLASGTMEGSDFTLVPRAGRAMEFVYRMSYYERPMVDLSGQHFTVLDSTALGVHRADASALELSDSALSLALEWIAASDSIRHRQAVEMGPDGYPVIWLKSNRKQDDVHVEAKSYRCVSSTEFCDELYQSVILLTRSYLKCHVYRLSFVRAALMITSARHEAQLKVCSLISSESLVSRYIHTHCHVPPSKSVSSIASKLGHRVRRRKHWRSLI